jgi:Pyrimidine dimer DNA glycosylase
MPSSRSANRRATPGPEPGAVRIWDLDPVCLCRPHLLGEHRELHAVWTILTEDRRGYRHHPETLRWEGKLAALYLRHEALVVEMARRGYRHASPLDGVLATGAAVQDDYVDSPARQRELLRAKGCECAVGQVADEAQSARGNRPDSG